MRFRNLIQIGYVFIITIFISHNLVAQKYSKLIFQDDFNYTKLTDKNGIL